MTADMRRRQIAEAVSFLGLLQFSGMDASDFNLVRRTRMGDIRGV